MVINHISKYQKLSNISMIDLAHRAKVNYHTLNNVKNNNRNITMANGLRIAKALHQPVDKVFELKE